MKLLFLMRNPAYVRNYESAIVALAQRGHQVNINFNILKDDDRLQERLAKLNGNIVYTNKLLPRREDIWTGLVILKRGVRDYLRYLSPEYASAHKLRERVEKHLRGFPKLGFYCLQFLSQIIGLKRLDRWLKMIEAIVPSDSHITEFLKSENPDLILITPLVDFDSIQTDYQKSAQELGIGCILCVNSWDNLTNKGLIQIEPDRVLLWNNFQKQEAIALHGVAPENITVTGAQCYDKWFNQQPSTSRTEFCDKVGLNRDRPYLLYLCSSGFIAPQEVSFVEDWLQQARKSQHPCLREVGLLVRPHPQNAQQWSQVDFSEWDNVAIWPRGGQNPVTDEARANFYDSIYHSAAVLGVNTSAMIESGILGKPVYTILDPRFKATQEGTLHFQHLVRGGLLQLSHHFEEHLEQLRSLLEGNSEAYRHQIQQFIHEFVRPHGLETPCTPIVVEAIEEMLARKPVEVKSMPKWMYGFQLLLLLVAIPLEQLRYLYKKSKRMRQGTKLTLKLSK
jgi:hypothetical protein